MVSKLWSAQGVVACCAVSCAVFCLLNQAFADEPRSAVAALRTRHYALSLGERVRRLEPVLLHALARARSARSHEPARCLDGALSELHGLQRQLDYHVLAIENAPAHEPEHGRHERALTLIAARVDMLASSGARCSFGGLPSGRNTTQIEVICPKTVRPRGSQTKK